MIPDMIIKFLSDLSYHEEKFQKARLLYENTLKESDHKPDMEYEINEMLKNRNRQQKVIWFNLLYSQNMKTNIGQVFLNLVKKHFPKHHKVHQIFNTITLKVSYYCMKNISSIIKQHTSEPATNCPCNCRNRDSCPLDETFLKQCLVYKARVNTGNHYKYIMVLTTGISGISIIQSHTIQSDR